MRARTPTPPHLLAIVPIVVAGILLTLTPTVSAEWCYRVTDLGPMPGEHIPEPHALSATGQVVGEAGFSGFLWTKGDLQSLGTLGGLGSPAYDINDAGLIVGWSHTVAAHDVRAYLWSGGQMLNLGTLPGGTFSAAWGINNEGWIVGVSDAGWAEFGRAFLLADGTMRDLGTLPGGLGSSARAINGKGHVAGDSEIRVADHIELHAALWLYDGVTDLGTLGGHSSHSTAINDRGEVVGWSKTGRVVEVSGYELQVEHAFRWRGGDMIDLGTLGGVLSKAWDVNNAGVIVGEAELYYDDILDADTHAALWLHGEGIDLNELIAPDAGWILWRALAINDAGQIAGLGYKTGAGAGTHAFLLTPLDCPSLLGAMPTRSVATHG